MIYYVIYPSNLAAPSAAQIKAGQDVTGAFATAHGNETLPSGDQTYTFATPATGLTPSTSYKVAFVWSDGTLNSAVSVSAAWVTPYTSLMAAKESEADLLTGTGVVKVSGTLSAAETGSDKASAVGPTVVVASAVSIQSALQSLTPGAIVDMYEMDATLYGLGILRYSPFTNEKGLDIVWQGNTYFRMPITVEGYKKSSQGTLARPTLTIANVGGLVSSLMRTTNSLLGTKVTRKRTLARYLDAVNFVSGINPKADVNSHFPDEVYYVDRKAGENPEAVSLELAVAWDVTGVKLPLRQVIRDTCQWQYRDADCGYVGPPVAKIDDSLTTDPLSDRCSKHMSGCKLRWGANAQLPASFFPAVGLIK